MRNMIVIGVAAIVGLAPVSAFAANNDAQTAPPVKSERAMTPNSSQPDATPDKTMSGRSATTASERAMSPDAGQAGTSPAPKSERAMDPAKSEK